MKSRFLRSGAPIALVDGFLRDNGFAYDMHNPWVKNHGFVHMVFYGCFLYNLHMKKKYIKVKVYDSCPSGKPTKLYLIGARFKPCLHPYV